MDQVSPDLLLMIFKKLNSKEMVSIMRVERKWLQIIDEHKALWRELVLPPKNQDDEEEGWGLQALELFDRKSNSTLKRVSMEVGWWVDSGPFVGTLERSKDTLRVLELEGEDWNRNVEEVLGENIWKFPNLADCRLKGPPDWDYKLSLQMEERNEDEEDEEGSSLRVLWIPNSEKLLKSHLYILDNLVSLLLGDENYDSSEMRRILERPSRTLKHLQINIEGEENRHVPPLTFPTLTFLYVTLNNDSASVFPSWMRLPSLSTLAIYNRLTLSSLPACSRLWLAGLNEFDGLLKLASQCPKLVELKMELGKLGRSGEKLSARERFGNISFMSNQRKANVEAGMEIEGVKMINLKTLVIPFEDAGLGGETGSKEARLWKLRELVEEVVDLDEHESDIFEMEV